MPQGSSAVRSTNSLYLLPFYTQSRQLSSGYKPPLSPLSNR